MYKVGVIGDRASVLGFQSVGLDVFPVNSGEDARKLVHRLAGEEYAILYITEKIAAQIPGEVDKYKDVMLPAIITIPDRNGATGEGLRNVSKAVERAVGADILFGGEK